MYISDIIYILIITIFRFNFLDSIFIIYLIILFTKYSKMILNLAGININNKLSFVFITISICIIYGIIYWYFGSHENFHFIDPDHPHLTPLDALYFAFTTHSTLGYGDITPKSQFMRTISISHTIMIILTLTYANLS